MAIPLRRIAPIVLGTVGVLLTAVVLYLAFGDLSRHKGRIEALVTEALGRSFAIDGTLELQVLPSIAVAAERVRLQNADWGSRPQMVEVGRFSLQVGLWSLLSGPIDVRSFELNDVSVLLEKNADGKGNWEFGDAGAPEEAKEPADGRSGTAPLVIRSGKLGNVRLTYREPGKPPRVALIETLVIGPGAGGLLAISGKAMLDEFPASVSGELGPLEALLSGRDLRMAIQAGLGDLRVDVKGGIGRLDPLDGADLSMKLTHPDMGAMLKKLQLPVVVTGPLTADARLADAGELTRLDLAAKLGDITVKVGGTLRSLGLPGSDFRIDASVADVARLAAVLGVTGLPAGALDVGGRVAASRTEITLDGLGARYAGASARTSGTIRLARAPSTDLRFELAAESLARLQHGLPAIPLSMNGSFASSRGKLEVKNLKGKVGASEISGRVSAITAGKKRIDIELASPRVDLTPFLAEPPEGKARPKPKPQPKEAERKFVFGEEPLPLGDLKATDARLQFKAGELVLGTEALRDVESTLRLEGGVLTLEGRARDSLDGSIGGAIKLTPADAGAAALDVSVSAKKVRFGIGAGAAVKTSEAPPTSVEAKLLAKGASARQLASLANGWVVVTQGPGKMQGSAIGLVGGDLVREMIGKLNPFAAQDPYTELDCTVVRADIVDGQMTINPVLMQSRKVTIVAGGQIDLRTETLKLDFNTRPRTGVGVSAGMFTNPFIELAGTLASPRLGIGVKGTAAAAATGGISVLAQGLFDRARGTQDLCKATLDETAGKAK